MLKKIKQCGVTLLELLMVIIILAIIAGMSFQLLFQSINGYFTAINMTDANWQGQIAMQTMARAIKLVRSPNDIVTATNNQFTFVNMNNNTISYELNGNSLMHTKNNNKQILADGISSLMFNYYDKTGTSTTTLTNIAYIKITINVIQKNANYTITSAIFPTNF